MSILLNLITYKNQNMWKLANFDVTDYLIMLTTKAHKHPIEFSI